MTCWLSLLKRFPTPSLESKEIHSGWRQTSMTDTHTSMLCGWVTSVINTSMIHSSREISLKEQSDHSVGWPRDLLVSHSEIYCTIMCVCVCVLALWKCVRCSWSFFNPYFQSLVYDSDLWTLCSPFSQTVAHEIQFLQPILLSCPRTVVTI